VAVHARHLDGEQHGVHGRGVEVGERGPPGGGGGVVGGGGRVVAAGRVAGERKCLETVFYCSIFTSAKKETELPPRDGRWTYSFR
jgi:hypothetical protein